ncbi:hypothetical protein SNEBB_005765, partial [Seison nebaliae]
CLSTDDNEEKILFYSCVINNLCDQLEFSEKLFQHHSNVIATEYEYCSMFPNHHIDDESDDRKKLTQKDIINNLNKFMSDYDNDEQNVDESLNHSEDDLDNMKDSHESRMDSMIIEEDEEVEKLKKNYEKNLKNEEIYQQNHDIDNEKIMMKKCFGVTQVDYIRYGDAPIDDLRFQRIQTFEEDENEPDIIRQSSHSETENSIEDRLFLHITYPKTGINHPVLILFIDGTYMNNLKENLKRISLIYRITFVVVESRSRLFGYLSFIHNHFPPNNHLFDQFEAIKWIKRNIQQFNGDPYSLSIMARDFYATTSLYHLLSSKYRSFVDQFIIIDPLLRNHRRTIQTQSKSISSVLKLIEDDKLKNSKEIEEKLLELSPETIIQRSSLLPPDSFAPQIDNDFISNPLPPNYPIYKMTDNLKRKYSKYFPQKTPSIAMISTAQAANTIVHQQFPQLKNISKSDIMEFIEKEIIDKKYISHQSDKDKKEILRKIKSFYFFRKTSEEIFGRLLSDIIFVAPALSFIEKYSVNSPTFFMYVDQKNSDLFSTVNDAHKNDGIDSRKLWRFIFSSTGERTGHGEKLFKKFWMWNKYLCLTRKPNNDYSPFWPSYQPTINMREYLRINANGYVSHSKNLRTEILSFLLKHLKNNARWL